MANEKKASTNLSQTSKNRRRRSGLTGALILVLSAVVIVFNMIVSLGETSLGLKLDLTANKIYTLNVLSEDVLHNLDTDLVIYSFAAGGTQSKLIQNTLERYSAATPRIEVRVEDPAKNPVLARKFSREGALVTNNTLVVCKPDDESIFRLITEAEMYTTNTDKTATYWVLEQKLTSAIMFLSSDAVTNVYLLTGHGEAPDDAALSDAVSALTTRLKEQNYNVSTLNITQNPGTLKKGDILMILGPTSDLIEEERAQLISFLDAHGKAVFMLDPQPGKDTLKNFYSVLDNYLIRMGSDSIYEQDNDMRTEKSGFELVPALLAGDITTPIISENAPIYLSNACSVQYYGPEKENLTTEVLASTSTSSVLVPAADLAGNAYLGKLETYQKNTYTTGLAYSLQDTRSVLADAQTRMVVLGTSSPATGSRMNSVGNLSLVQNSVNWVANRQNQLFIQGIQMQTYELSLASYTLSYVLIIVVIVVVPLAALAAGFIVWMRRKNL